MLTELRLENFKCFGPEVVVPFRRLSLLTGINGKGKSTCLQALLLMHQSVDRALSGTGVLDRVELNGRYARLGAFREIRHRDCPRGEPVQMAFEFDDLLGSVTTTRLWLQQDNDDSRWAGMTKVEVELVVGNCLQSIIPRNPPEDVQHVSLDLRTMDRDTELERLGRVHYVSADRLGPQDFFPLSSDPGFSSVGVRGENTAEILYQAEQERQTVDDVRTREGAETIVVTDQASAWLSYIFDGGAVRVPPPYNNIPILTLEMNSDGSVHYHRPVNLGFGYSYALPIVVAGLIARPGEILVAENPEAHLHPLAQSRMGEFLATVSASGVQVFVESHSEHILNAFRLAVKERHIDEEALSVLYFRKHGVEPIVRIPVAADGRIPHWPDGFFDQRTHDFFRLFGGD